MGSINSKSANEVLDFTIDGPQTYYCHWRKRERTMIFNGVCESCGKRTYAFTDGENDPRGPLGDHAAFNLEPSDYNAVGRPIVGCFSCSNDQNAYLNLMSIAEEQWQS